MLQPLKDQLYASMTRKIHDQLVSPSSDISTNEIPTELQRKCKVATSAGVVCTPPFQGKISRVNLRWSWRRRKGWGGERGCESVRRRGGRAEADSIMIIPRMKFTADHHARRAGNVEGAW